MCHYGADQCCFFPPAGSQHGDRLETQCVECIAEELIFYTFIKWRGRRERWRYIDLDEPRLELMIEEDIESENFKAVCARQTEL